MRTLTNSTREKTDLEPAVLLLHGFAESGLMWLHIVKKPERDHDVIIVDARGHGRPEGIAKGRSSKLLVADAPGL